MKEHTSIGATRSGAESHGALYAELEQQEEQMESALACTPTQAARFSEAVESWALTSPVPPRRERKRSPYLSQQLAS